ncbi:MAG: GGDEF domain-containing protein [Alphaproteobacteria bacterium]
MADAEIQKFADFAQSALKLMAEQKLAPSPENYELWFSHVSGTNQELSRAVSDRLNAGKITQEDCSALHKRFFARSSSAEQAFIELGNSVSAEIANVQNILENASRDQTTYGDTLQGVSGQLNKSQDPAKMKAMIDNLVAATRSMVNRSQTLEQRLQQSKDEVNKLQENYDAARAEARTDQLTQLSNRKAFDEAFESALNAAVKNNESLCLVIGDIDHFKKFNDTWGHQTGDQVLRLVAHCMRESVRDRDFPARYGGEEFAVILPTATIDIAAQIAERIRWNVESKRVMKRSTGEDLGTITMSLGVALLRPGEDGAALIKRADAALYAAKRAGRNRVLTERQLDTPAEAERAAPRAASG